MRRKITEAPELDVEGLPELTHARQEFVRLMLSGKTATDSYRGAFDCSAWSNNAVWVEASRLANHPEILLWLSAARQACLGTAILTREAHMAQLERLREIAIASGNVGAAVQAEFGRGKVAGHQVERIQEIPADPVDTLKELERHQPELAAQLAQAHGIPWKADEGATKH